MLIIKKTTTQIASFKSCKVSAMLPTFGRLRNSNGDLKSEWVYLIEGAATYFGKEADAEKGYNYYASVKTSDFEFGSGNYVSFKFSVDKNNFLITHNQQVNPIIEIIFKHKIQEN